MSESFKNRRTGTRKRASGFSDDQEYDEKLETEIDESVNKVSSLEVDTNTKELGDKNCLSNFILNSNEIICIANILASVFGVGIFTFPYILYEIGVINSLIIFIILTISVYFSIDLLRRFVVDSKLFSYSAITQETLGNCWQKVYLISTFSFYTSNIVNSLKIVNNLAKSMMTFLNDPVPKIFYSLIVFVIELLLCIFTSNLSKIYIFSFIALGGFIISLFIVIIKGIIVLCIDNDRFKYFYLFTIQPENSSSWAKFLKLMAKIIEFYYGYICHSTFPTLLSELENLDNENTKKVHNISFSIMCTIYTLFSFFGLFCIENIDNKDNQYNNILFINGNDMADNNALICIFKCMLIVLFISVVPLRYLIIRDIYTSIIGKEIIQQKMEIIITSSFFVITSLIIYFATFDIISNLIFIFGGFFGVIIGFVLPIINYVAINGRTKIRSIIGYVVAGIYVVIGFFSIFYNFKEVNS